MKRISGNVHRLIKVLVPVAVAVAVFAPSSALAVDVDQNGTHDMHVREGQFYPRTAGGDCRASYQDHGGVRRQVVIFSVRPPEVWPLWGLLMQRVAWRANFFSADTGQRLFTSAWEYTRTVPNGTLFGGFASRRAILGTRQYLAGSHRYEHDPAVSVRASVDVAWLNARNGEWVYGSSWVNDMTIQTFGAARVPFSGGIGGNLIGTALLQRNAPRC